jgi:hypothetical protein
MMITKTNDTTKPRELTEDHRPLADSELDVVSGGWLPLGGLPGTSVPERPRPTGYVKMSDIQLK